jgi:hypothetical protein
MQSQASADSSANKDKNVFAAIGRDVEEAKVLNFPGDNNSYPGTQLAARCCAFVCRDCDVCVHRAAVLHALP